MKKIKHFFKGIISAIFLFFAWFYGFWIFKIVNSVKVIGKENIPRTSNVLYVCNHQTLIDSFLIGISVSRITDVFFNNKLIPYNTPDKENFFGQRLFTWVFKYLKNSPIRRPKNKEMTELREMKKDLMACGEKLKKDTVVMFFEGGRSRDGSIGECKSGVAEIIYKYNPVVIPIYIENIGSIMPVDIGFNFFRPAYPFTKRHKGLLVIGKPIDFGLDLKELSENKAEKEIAKKVRESVIDLAQPLIQ
jgi:1-acyl-sn-glycerol-3-phosphate acyltransferase